MPDVYVPIKRKMEKIVPEDKWKHWADEKKIEAVTLYLVTGSLAEVSRSLKVPYITVKSWKYSDWWDDVEEEILHGENVRVANQIKKVVAKAVTQLEERLDKGDIVFDKHGRKKRVPVKAKELSSISKDLIDRRLVLTRQPTKITKQESEHKIEDKLEKLAKAFINFAKGKAEEKVIQGEYKEVGDMLEVRDQRREERDAIYDERKEGLQERTPVGTQEEAQSG